MLREVQQAINFSMSLDFDRSIDENAKVTYILARFSSFSTSASHLMTLFHWYPEIESLYEVLQSTTHFNSPCFQTRGKQFYSP